MIIKYLFYLVYFINQIMIVMVYFYLLNLF